MKHVQIISEVGECFNGNMETARRMIELSAALGCDTVKFQILDVDEISEDDPEREWFFKVELTPSKIKDLINFAQNSKIDILFTPTSVKTAEWIYEAGQTQVKIASSFVKKRDLLQFINQNFQLVYASTGMASLEEISEMLRMLDGPREIRLLHCISEYPTGPLLNKRGLVALDEKDARLEMMSILKAIYPDLRIGYSDHTDGIFVPIVAASMGADIIEKHFTLDKKTPIEHFEKGLEYMGTDHVLSIEPDELGKMVSEIRRIEKIKGDRNWERTDGEKILMEFLHGRYTERH